MSFSAGKILPGQITTDVVFLDKFRNEGLEEKDKGWYLVPGKVDKVSYVLLAYFALVIGFLAIFEHMF